MYLTAWPPLKTGMNKRQSALKKMSVKYRASLAQFKHFGGGMQVQDK